jgi:hypothetical protein
VKVFLVTGMVDICYRSHWICDLHKESHEIPVVSEKHSQSGLHNEADDILLSFLVVIKLQHI